MRKNVRAAYADSLSKADQALEQGDTLGARLLVEDLVSQLDTTPDTTPEELLDALCSLAHIVGREHDVRTFTSRSRELLDRALAHAAASFGDKSAQASRVQRIIAGNLFLAGQAKEAITLMRAVVEQAERDCGARGVGNALREFGFILIAAAEFEEATQVFERCWRISRPEKQDLILDLLVQLGLAQALLGLRRPDDALPHAQAAREALIMRFGPTSGRLRELDQLIADILKAQGGA